MKELSKLTTIIRLLDNIRSANNDCVQALNFILNPTPQLQVPITETYTLYKQADEDVREQIKNIFDTWSQSLSTTVLKTKWYNELKRIRNQIGTLNFQIFSTEVNEACERQCDYVYRNSKGYSRAEIKELVEKERGNITGQLSKSKQDSVRSQMVELFSSSLLPLGAQTYNRLIDAFMNEDCTPLADALLNQERAQAQQEIKKQFLSMSLNDIGLALDDSSHAIRIAREESHRQLNEQKIVKDKLEAGFVQINLGKEDEPIDLEGKCLWVPASVRHEVKKDDTSGLTRYSFFVYGGVNVQPRINMVTGRNAPLSGNRVGGGSFNRNNITKGFQDHHIASNKNQFTKDHQLWKLSGVNVNSRSRCYPEFSF